MASSSATSMGGTVGVVIREARVEDAPVLLRYATDLFAERLPGLYLRPPPSLQEEREFISAHADPPNSVLLVAMDNGRVAGVAALQGRSLEQEVHVGSAGISVADGLRGRGIGTALLEALLAWASEHGVSRIEIEAFANNPGAVRLYERLGFVHEGVRKSAVLIEDRYMDVICLAHSLEE